MKKIDQNRIAMENIRRNTRGIFLLMAATISSKSAMEEFYKEFKDHQAEPLLSTAYPHKSMATFVNISRVVSAASHTIFSTKPTKLTEAAQRHLVTPLTGVSAEEIQEFVGNHQEIIPYFLQLTEAANNAKEGTRVHEIKEHVTMFAKYASKLVPGKITESLEKWEKEYQDNNANVIETPYGNVREAHLEDHVTNTILDTPAIKKIKTQEDYDALVLLLVSHLKEAGEYFGTSADLVRRVVTELTDTDQREVYKDFVKAFK